MLTRRSLLKIIIEEIVGLVFTVLILVFANMFNAIFDNSYLDQIVSFMNHYFYLVLISWFLGFVAKSVAAFIFPINIGAPAIHSVNSIIVVYIIIRFIHLLGVMFTSSFLLDLADSNWMYALYVFVLFIVLLYNLLDVILDLKTDKHEKLKDKIEEMCDDEDEKKEKAKDGKSKMGETKAGSMNNETKADKTSEDKGKKFERAIKNAVDAFKKTMEEK